ncbi:hypothetical protein HELRODRAFT_183420 [Helobdella robusta]|uniref:Uncharacterized protein n=1 Tax=Helobdella robusta TaxID=6412 RepID=T1FJM1_HELRO|nr:hypothetical protein HELRODRAFT_183420 [Helobdella robusta]ESO11180.1 hypothetical protein HELRODRAFT_183420 [Helobdella robusta]
MNHKLWLLEIISKAECLSIQVCFVVIFAKFNSAYNPSSENIRQSVYHVGHLNPINVISVTYNLNNGQIRSKVVIGVRSRVECSVLCRSEVSFACKEFKYEISGGKCQLVNVFIPNVNDLPGEIKVRYSLKEACPPGTTYIPLIRSCLVLITQKMSWFDARLRCNNMPLKFHPLVINSPDVTVALIIFLNSLSS